MTLINGGYNMIEIGQQLLDILAVKEFARSQIGEHEAIAIARQWPVFARTDEMTTRELGALVWSYRQRARFAEVIDTIKGWVSELELPRTGVWKEVSPEDTRAEIFVYLSEFEKRLQEWTDASTWRDKSFEMIDAEWLRLMIGIKWRLDLGAFPLTHRQKYDPRRDRMPMIHQTQVRMVDPGASMSTLAMVERWSAKVGQEVGGAFADLATTINRWSQVVPRSPMPWPAVVEPAVKVKKQKNNPVPPQLRTQPKNRPR